MEIKEKLIVKYEKLGHYMYPEDTWESERVICNVNDLFQFMKDLQRRDAKSYNNYPLNGGCYIPCFSFSIEKSVEINGEIYVNHKRENVGKPEYFDGAYKMYEVFHDRVRTTLPNLREARDKKSKELKERAKLVELQNKYGEDINVK